MNFYIISEEKENQNIHYYCIAAGSHRYDFAVIFSEKFLGKAMVVSIQSGRMVLLCREDIDHPEHWDQKLGIAAEDIKEIESFFHSILDQRMFSDQY